MNNKLDEKALEAMTPSRASYFLRRFKNDEKMLGPNEQKALEFAIAAIEATQVSKSKAAWQPMSTAPIDGKHCILSIQSGSSIYSIQGAFMKGKWTNAANIEAEPLAWMPNILLPDEFRPWSDAFKARAALAGQEPS